jgi:hypothetical protein
MQRRSQSPPHLSNSNLPQAQRLVSRSHLSRSNPDLASLADLQSELTAEASTLPILADLLPGPLQLPNSPALLGYKGAGAATSGQSVLADWEVAPHELEICRRPDGSLWQCGAGAYGAWRLCQQAYVPCPLCMLGSGQSGRAGGQSKQTGARCWMPTPPSPCLLLLLLLPPACLPALRLQAVFTRQCGLACSPSRLKCWR